MLALLECSQMRGGGGVGGLAGSGLQPSSRAVSLDCSTLVCSIEGDRLPGRGCPPCT